MRSLPLFLVCILVSAAALAQDNSRDALIKRSLERDRGEVTAMEPSTRPVGGVIIAYSSGDLVHCHGEGNCRKFEGTPSVSAREISITRPGESEILWVAYRHGDIYRCVDYYCKEFRH